MLQAVVAWSVAHRVVVVGLAALLLAAGAAAAREAHLDVFPDFAPPQVVVQTEAPGLSPPEVEQLVTLPVEAAVNGAPRLAALRSQSVQGLSVVTVIFDDGADVYRARQQISERLAELAGRLPAGVSPPRLAPLTSATGRLLTVGFTAPGLSPLALRDRVQWLVRPRVLGVRGVGQVTLFGGEVRQFQVRVHPDFLAVHQLTVHDVLDATRQATGVQGAGFIENANQRLTLRVEGQIRTAGELGETVVVKTPGSPVRLRDVAEVVEAGEPKIGDASIDGEPGVLLIVHKQLGADTPDVTRRVEEELARLEPVLKRDGITYHAALFRQANFIESAIGNVTESLLLGAVLVAAVLGLFLFNLRTAFIALTAIPLSLLGAVLVLVSCGASLNTLTLGGLAIAVGEVVDDAIIDVENIYRRLGENAALPEPRPAPAVVLAASLEVRGAVVYATFIVVLVFVPVFFLTGLQGRLFAPLAYAYVLAVLASLAVALTVTPALSLLLLRGRASGGREPPVNDSTGGSRPPLAARLSAWHARVERGLKDRYERLLRRFDRQVPLVLTSTAALLAAAVVALFQCGGAFLPELRENHFVVHMRGLPGTSLPQSLATGGRVRRSLRELPEVRSVCQQVGRAELGEDTWGVEYSELEVDLKPLGAEELEKVDQQIKGRLRDHFAGFAFEVLPFLSERIKETLSGTTGTIAVKVYGDDLEAVDRAAQDVARVLKSVKGPDGGRAADNVRVEPQTGAPELVVRPRPADLQRLGLRRAHVLDAVHTAYQGAEVGQAHDRNRTIDLVVILEPGSRADPDAVGRLWIKGPGTKAAPDSSAPGDATTRVQLKDVADVFLSDGRFLISHEGGLRRQVVMCDVAPNLDVETFARRVEAALRQTALPPGVTHAVTGEHEARRAAERELWTGSLLAGAGILLLLGLVFRSPRRMLLVLVNLPFALVGGVAAVYLGGGLLDVGALVGFVTLFGITMRNAIMMVSHWQHLHEAEGMPWGPELVYRGARGRLAPVLMTALVTALGLMPIAVGSGEAGREIEGPMAQVILGGLVTSTALNLLVLPVLYRRFGQGETVSPAGEVVA